MIFVDPARPGALQNIILAVPARPGALQTKSFVNPAPPEAVQNIIFVDPAPPGALQKIFFVESAPHGDFQKIVFVDPPPPEALQDIVLVNPTPPETSRAIFLSIGRLLKPSRRYCPSSVSSSLKPSMTINICFHPKPPETFQTKLIAPASPRELHNTSLLDLALPGAIQTMCNLLAIADVRPESLRQFNDPLLVVCTWHWRSTPCLQKPPHAILKPMGKTASAEHAKR